MARVKVQKKGDDEEHRVNEMPEAGSFLLTYTVLPRHSSVLQAIPRYAHSSLVHSRTVFPTPS
jgi:hypothetical protein